MCYKDIWKSMFIISVIEVHSFLLTKSWPSIQHPNTIWNGKRNYNITRGDLSSGLCDFRSLKEDV